MLRSIMVCLLCISIGCTSETEQFSTDVTGSGKNESELNMIKQKIIEKYSDDELMINKFKQSQKAWIQYRNAQLEMKFPLKDKRSNYGSIYSNCVAYYITELNEERIRCLTPWLKGIEEGESCRGSVK